MPDRFPADLRHELPVVPIRARPVRPDIDLDPDVHAGAETAGEGRQSLRRFDQDPDPALGGQPADLAGLEDVEREGDEDVPPAVRREVRGHVDRRDGDRLDPEFAEDPADMP